jgi:hypothetical protein
MLLENSGARIIDACPAWKLTAELQRLQKEVLCTTGSIPRRTPVRNLHTAFSLLYGDNKICMKQAEVIQSHENKHVRSIGQGEARYKKILEA